MPSWQDERKKVWGLLFDLNRKVKKIEKLSRPLGAEEEKKFANGKFSVPK